MPPPGNTASRPRWRTLTAPIAALTSSLLLLVDAASLPSNSGAMRLVESIVGRRGTHCFFPFIAPVSLVNGQWEQQKDSTAEFVVYFASYARPMYQSFFWAPTAQTIDTRMSIIPIDAATPAPSPASRAALRTSIAEWLDANKATPGPFSTQLRAGESLTSSTNWKGVAHNAVAALLALIAITSTATTIKANRRKAWQQHLHLQGLCSHCAYDRQGVPSNAPCPECGITPSHAVA